MINISRSALLWLEKLDDSDFEDTSMIKKENIREEKLNVKKSKVKKLKKVKNKKDKTELKIDPYQCKLCDYNAKNEGR